LAFNDNGYFYPFYRSALAKKKDNDAVPAAVTPPKGAASRNFNTQGWKR